MSKLESIIQDIEEVEHNFDEDNNTIGDNPAIFFIGGTGAGKTSLITSLLDKPLIIKRDIDETLILEGKGISSGINSETKISTLFPSPKNKLAFIDNPGFFETEGVKDDIKHAYGIYYLFTRGNDNSKNFNFKIIFVIQDPEIKALRGKPVKEDYDRLVKMFGSSDVLKGGVGIVITKAREGINYSKSMSRFADGVLKDCPIFLFFEPKKEDLGKQYVFEEQGKLIEYQIFKINVENSSFEN